MSFISSLLQLQDLSEICVNLINEIIAKNEQIDNIMDYNKCKNILEIYNKLDDSFNTNYISHLKMKSENLKNIQKEIKTQLLCNCKHNIIQDYIDISEEKSQIIRYCDICQQTFS